jgi:predicted transcriptional regulator
VVTDKREVFADGVDEATELLEWARRRAELSASGLAKRLGYATTTVQEYREGRRKRVGWAFMVRWLHACGFRVWIARSEDGD